MGSFIDLTGKKFGRLLVLRKAEEKRGKEIVWVCQCDCGKEHHVAGSDLRSGKTKSCGCYKTDYNKSKQGPWFIDLTGLKFGHWTVLQRVENNLHGETQWLCECDCVAHTKRIVTGSSLRKGLSLSCGCERRSHGELKIAEILFNNNISFEQEYRPFKFSNGYYASFDFYVNNQYFIEFDGIQHFKSRKNNSGWNTEKSLQQTQERDAIKNQWCKDNNIPLIRIPYTHLEKLTLADLQLETSQFIVS